MPNTDARSRDAELLTIAPFGGGGLDMSTSSPLLPEDALATAENCRSESLAFVRRLGAVKIARLDTTGGSKTFGGDGKYATINADGQLLIGAGGFAFGVHFTAVRPSGGNTAWLLSSNPAAVAYSTMYVKLSDAGVITVGWTDSGLTDRSIALTAVSDGATVHLLAIYDDVAGTFTAYVNGTSSGTPLTGLSTSLKPAQATTNWVIGVHKVTGGAVTANTHFDGAVDGMYLMSLAGIPAASGSPTLTSVLLKHSLHQWPNPAMDNVLFCYDMDGSSLTSLTDSSEYLNHAAVTGVITSTSAVAFNANVGNFAGSYDTADGSRYNLFASAGTLYYEKTA